MNRTANKNNLETTAYKRKYKRTMDVFPKGLDQKYLSIAIKTN